MSFQFSHTKFSFGQTYLVYFPHIIQVARQPRRFCLEFAFWLQKYMPSGFNTLIQDSLHSTTVLVILFPTWLPFFKKKKLQFYSGSTVAVLCALTSTVWYPASLTSIGAVQCVGACTTVNRSVFTRRNKLLWSISNDLVPILRSKNTGPSAFSAPSKPPPPPPPARPTWTLKN